VKAASLPEYTDTRAVAFGLAAAEPPESRFRNPLDKGQTIMRDERLQWTSASRTHVGRVRKLNEDAFLELPRLGLWAVADGMGGHSAGEVASRMVVDTLSRLERSDDLEEFILRVRRAIQQVNLELAREARRRGGQMIGCTVALLLIAGDRAVCLWAGDSRIFLLRERRLQQLTRDHSRIEEMISQGLISRQEADGMPGNNAITRAVGVMEGLELDTLVHDVREGDSFLLCSDGLYNELKPDDIERHLQSADCQQAADRLLNQALQGRARDNITVVVVNINEDQATRTVFNPSAVRPTASHRGASRKHIGMNCCSAPVAMADSVSAQPTDRRCGKLSKV